MIVLDKNITIRVIQPDDNRALAGIVRDTLVEFGANRPGTVYFDEATDHLYETFRAPRCIYYTALDSDEVVGGGGIFPSPGLPEHTCELVKMYLVPRVRGIGLGRTLIEKCLAFAREAGYSQVYLESMPELKQALSIYERSGFGYITAPMGNTGHFGCHIWMLKKL